jgi:hypothetical protein
LTLWRSLKAFFHKAKVAAEAPDVALAERAETAAQIDALMSLPIKERSLVTVVGDEGVSGYNPAPQPPSGQLT